LLGYRETPDPAKVLPTAPVSAEQLHRLPIWSIMVGTDGANATTERARTILELAYPANPQAPNADGDFESDFTNTLNGWKQLANVVVVASLVVAGCSLAVSIAGGLSERKRPFSLLRLSGVPVRVLRRVVALESAVPLLVVSAVAIGTGLVAAQLFLTAQMQYTLSPPGPVYYVIVGGGILASLGIIASMLPMLERITGPETARNE
jgi:predicted lysophospholipase L1 biosynthesis ABC-type transport system permease subunit